jgi:hypothetical protein
MLLSQIFRPALPKAELSKNAKRRLAHTSLIYEDPMWDGDDSERHVRGMRFDIGRFLDRSKYNGDGTIK